MISKVCFKCNIEKPLNEYYKHPKMGDGHLGKCKECTKKDSINQFNIKKNDINWVEKEKKRARDKYYRLGYKELHKLTPEQKHKSTLSYKKKYPEKYQAYAHSNKLKPTTKGNHLHHWSYNIEHAKDTIELSPKEHYKLHRYIIYDQEQMMYRRCDTLELLDTKERHIQFYKTLENKD